MMNLRGSRIPLVSLSRVFGAADRLVTEDQTILVLKPAGGDCYALSVDAVLDHAELVIKPAAPVVMAAGLYAGTTLTDDGSPILLLDASGIAIAAGIQLGQKQVEKADASEPGASSSGPETQVLVFRTLDGIKRAISLGVVLRIEDVQADAARLTAGKLRIALDDKILPLAGFGERRCEGRLRILRLSDGVSELAYAFEEVIDLVTLRNPIKAASVAGEIGGVTLIGGDQVELIDPFWLFSVHATDAASAPSRPVCAIPADDQWMQNILRPVIESAGYLVVAPGEVAAPDILIASADDPVDGDAATGDIIRIRALPEASPGKDDSIYRYDRAALLAALGRRAGRKG
jgi:two-component system chemotaxis sensor kinase CheA